MAQPKTLPFVRINIASTVDGKLAPQSRRFVPFSSPRDRALLLQLRAEADAVMCGARTVDLDPINLGPGPLKYRRMRLAQGLPEYNLRVVVSGTASLDPQAEIFRHRFSPIIVLATARAEARKLERLRQVADDVGIFGEERVDFVEALRWLRQKWEVRHLLCEGGGEINAALFAEGLVDEIYLTLCPLVFGGRTAPTMADGEGVAEVAQGTALKLRSLKKVHDELFLVYRVRKTPKPLPPRPSDLAPAIEPSGLARGVL